MRTLALLTAGLAVASLASACSGKRTVAARGVRVTVPSGWHVVAPAGTSVTDPKTLLVVGTEGVRPKTASQCEIAAYHVPARGAVVVVVGWKNASLAGGLPKRGREPLKKLLAVTRPSFECFSGRGTAADVGLRGKAYQVNVMVGDRASQKRVAEALAVARSFDRAR
jgi:hypothetical protein